MPFKDYRVTSKYGWRVHPIQHVRKFHAGIDLVKGHKSLIQSFTDGTVMYAGLGVAGTGVGGYGNVVVIGDKLGNGHLYAHLDSVLVKKGQKVKKGDNIGRQGATGQVTGSHLHYEVRKNVNKSLGWTSNQEKSTYDPESYLKKYFGGGRVVTKLKVDGMRGTGTLKRWQQFLGTPEDGKLSSPSMAVKKWQQFLNKYGGAKLKVDGYEGTETIKAGQRFFGTTVDGKISRVSEYVKELQKFLNSYGQ